LIIFGGEQKNQKTKKTEKTRKKLKKSNREKNQIKPIKILKKPTGSVQFGFSFISLKLKKPNRTQTEKKPSQTEKKPSQNRFEPDFFLKNQTETN
jgi:hypothetical protein